MSFTTGQILAFIVAIFGFALTTLNIIDKIIAFKKKANEPIENLDKRITIIEEKTRDIELSLKKGNGRFEAQDRTNEVLIRSTFALIEFEIQYCLTENKPISNDLQRAKNELHDYLYKKSH